MIRKEKKGGRKKDSPVPSTSAATVAASASSKRTRVKSKNQVFVTIPLDSDTEAEDPTRTVSFQDDSDEDQEHSVLYDFIIDQDIDMIRDYIQSNVGKRNFSINMVNEKENADPLTFAVTKTLNVDVVAEILRVQDVQTRNGFLHAIRLQNMPIIEKILIYNNGDSKKSAQLIPGGSTTKRTSLTATAVATSSDFDEYITPIVLASTEGNYDVLEFFFNKGDRIEAPHAPNCLCDACKAMAVSLHRSYERLAIIKAMSHPNYLALQAGSDDDKDPIEECFSLIDKIALFVQQEPEYYDEYMKESKKIEKFTVDVLALCQTNKEVSVLMSKTRKDVSVVAPHLRSTEIEKDYPRLVAAMSSSKKAFIIHPHSQEILFQAWKMDKILGIDYDSTSPFGQIITILIMVILLPFWCIYAIFDPHLIRTQFGKPFARCVYSSAINVIFMLLLITLHSDVLSLGDRGETHIALKIVIFVFEINYIISFLQHIYLAWFVKAPFIGWDYFEVLNHCFFLVTFWFWLAAYLREDAPVVTRDKWAYDDPVLISEATMSVSTTMTFLKFLRLFVLHEELGPMQASLGKMLISVATFTTFYIIGNVAYALGLSYIYKPYKNFVYVDENGETQAQSPAFSSVEEAMESLLWVSGYLTGPETSKIIKMPETCHNKSNSLCVNGTKVAYNHHTFTEYFGSISFALFYFLNVTVLMNMLGAVMGKVYEKMSANYYADWKFSRSEVRMIYMKDKLAPPPFTFLTIFPALIGKCLSTVQHKKLDINSMKRERRDEYRILIRCLFQRCYRRVLKEASEDKPTKKTVNSIQNLVTRIGARKYNDSSVSYTSNSTF